MIVSVLKNDVIDYTGSLQVYTGQKAGIEAVVHPFSSMYNDENNYAVLLVANNAFNYNFNLILLQLSFKVIYHWRKRTEIK